MRYFNQSFLSLVFLLLAFSLFQQDSDAQVRPIKTDKIQPDNVYLPLIVDLYKRKIRKYRKKAGADTLVQHNVFQEASEMQAKWMKKEADADKERNDDDEKATPQKRLHLLGAKKEANVKEIVSSTGIGRGRTQYSYKRAVNQLWKSITRSRSNKKILRSDEYVYTGVSASYNLEEETIYLSHTLGSINSLNLGPKHKEKLSVPYEEDEHGVEDYDQRKCAEARQFYDYGNLQDGLFVEKNKIYIEYDKLGKLKELLDDEEDGLAVDVVQREQFQCGRPNIYDKSLNHKGIMTDPVYSEDFFEYNCIADDKYNRYVGQLGTIPEEIKGDYQVGDYELNLVVIQKERFCNTVMRSYTNMPDVKADPIIKLIPDTFITPGDKRFEPKTERKTLSLKVPFEQGKYEYDKDDIQPFLDNLNQPNFTFDSIHIVAHSSLEGDSAVNARLQKKRAKSIIDALEEHHADTIKQSIKTSDSWEMFQKQIKNSKKFSEHSGLADMDKDAVVDKLNSDSTLRRKLEPLLSKERFANITMDARIEVTGETELLYYRNKMEAALDSNDAGKALKLQRFMVGRVVDGVYDSSIILEHNFPQKKKYASLLLNKIWVKHHMSEETVPQKACEEIEKLSKMAPNAPTVKFNHIRCQIEHEPSVNKSWIDSMQNKIDALYNSDDIQDESVDALNLSLHMRVINELDTSKKLTRTVNVSLRKIQNILKPEQIKSSNTALKLAGIFSKHKDYDFSMKIMSPFITDKEKREDIGEKFLFAYISLASHYPKKVSTEGFRMAMRMAKKMNTDKYCQLIGVPKLSFQVLDDPFVKKTYCNTCQ